MNLIYKILEKNGNLEIVMRCAFERLAPIKGFALKIFNKDKNKNYRHEIKEGQWEKYKEQILKLGIVKGDILLVHSSIKGMGTLGVSAKEIIDFLLSIVGEKGTLVFPTYPDEKNMLQENGKYYYDPLKEIPWTGKLPRVFLSYPGVERSLFPHNTLAAKGKHAKIMMKDNLKANFSQGKYSSWDFCVKNNMKILYLGVKACTSCTIVHYPEDIMGESYPVKNWFKCDKYLIKTGDKVVEKDIYIRKRYWFRYYKMFNTGYWMKKNGYLQEYDIDGAYIGFMDNVKNMCEELCDMTKKRKLLFGIPKKYMK